MKNLYNFTRYNKDGTSVSWKAFSTEKDVFRMKENLEKDSQSEVSRLESAIIPPYRCAEWIGDYFLALGDFSERSGKESESINRDFAENFYRDSAQWIDEFLFHHTKPELFAECRSYVREPDRDYIREVIAEMQVLFNNAYEPYAELGRILDNLDRNEPDYPTEDHIYECDGEWLTADELINISMKPVLEEGEDGKQHPRVYLTVCQYMKELDSCRIVDIEDELPEVIDELVWRKSLGYSYRDFEDFRITHGVEIIPIPTQKLPALWQDVLSDTFTAIMR